MKPIVKTALSQALPMAVVFVVLLYIGDVYHFGKEPWYKYVLKGGFFGVFMFFVCLWTNKKRNK